jgi:hypothetical protein
MLPIVDLRLLTVDGFPIVDCQLLIEKENSFINRKSSILESSIVNRHSSIFTCGPLAVGPYKIRYKPFWSL